MQHDYDLIVIGGGPAGSTVSALLQAKGYRICLLEKTQHPRFHIGESLLPMNIPILERLGVMDKVKELGIDKHGAEFNAQFNDSGIGHLDHSSPWKRVTFYFNKAFNKQYPQAYEVKRSEFDHMLLQNSAEKGVDVREQTRVTKVNFIEPGHVSVDCKPNEGEPYQLSARFVIDASGRDSLLSRTLKLKQKNPHHQSSAIFGHFDNVTRREGKDEGNISIYWFEHGWFWMIPLKDGSMSVGAVCWPEYLKTRQGTTEEFLWQTIKMNSAVYERMKDANTIGEIRATGNFSYTSKTMSGRDFLLLGDAFTFIDPVFSSGVYIAMSSAEKAAEAVDRCLQEPSKAEKYCRALEKEIRAGIKSFSWFIYRFTSPAMQRLFMAPRNHFQLESAVISMLAGDVYDNPQVKWRLKLFRVVYYANALVEWKNMWRSWRQRRRNVGETFDKGTMEEDKIRDTV